MRKYLNLIAICTILLVLIACSDKSDANNNQNEQTNTNNDEIEETEAEENENDVDENNISNLGDENNLEEDSFVDEIKVLEVDKILIDQENISKVDKEDVLIEHDTILYVEHDLITELLDYELTYHEEDTFAEIFDGKGDFIYEPSHEDEGGAIMDVGQVYVEKIDDYKNIPSEEADLNKFIEYKGKLYIPERFINVRMESPISYKKRDQTIELGLRSEAISLYDFGIESKYSSSAEVTQDASDVTIEGKNHESGIVIRNVNSSRKYAGILTDFEHSKISGMIYNKAGDETIQVKFQYNEDKTIKTVDLDPNETYEFEYDVKGEIVFYITAKAPVRTEGELVIVGELK